MDNLEFVQGLYNGKYCYSDSMTEEQIALLRIPSGVEDIIRRMVAENRIIFLTGNPGDGKTYLIKAIMEHLHDVFIETDMNRVRDEKIGSLMNDIISCYEQNKPCIIAANEFPFHKLVNHFRVRAPKLYKEIMEVKRNVLIYGKQTLELKRICIIDLNERNLLDKDRCIVKQILDKFTSLLQPYSGSNTILAHNVSALASNLVQQQLLNIFSYISMSGQHFVIRDVLGMVSHMLVSCTDPDHEGSGFYYDAIFDGSNELMSFALQFDPTLLSSPTWDEKLWNGEITDGWQFGCPIKWPHQITKETGTVEDAVIRFKSIKRKFFFENVFAKELMSLQPQDYSKCIDILVRIKQDPTGIKRRLIRSMNLLCLSSDEEGDGLRAWTTHSYDLSRMAGAAVSTRYVPADELELVGPVPVEWLKEMEFVPSFLVMRSVKRPDIKLEIDMELLRSLVMIENGYPAALLSSRFEQVITQFVQALCAAGIARDYYDGEIIIANRHEGTKKKLRVRGCKYYLGKEADY